MVGLTALMQKHDTHQMVPLDVTKLISLYCPLCYHEDSCSI